MKVNKFGMLIKFAALYVCINFIVTSAIPLDDQKTDKQQAASVEAVEKDYDEMPDKSTEANTKPPLVFPSDDDKSTSKNETALEILQKNTNTSSANENPTAKEVTNGTNIEIKNKGNDEQGKADTNEKDQKTSDESLNKQEEPKKDEQQPKVEDVSKKDEETSDKDYENVSNENSDSDKEDAENIQENQDQGDLEERYGVNSTSINVFEEPTLKSGHIAFIFASCLVFLSATAYVGLVLWRKSLEHRYGMRQRLVTEDDYYNNNDVRFFGL